MQITIRRPCDFHIHLRKEKILRDLINLYNDFQYVVAMGNLNPPIATMVAIGEYWEEIIIQDPKFTPIMSLMLTSNTSPQIILTAHKARLKVLKMIPGNTSTGSDDGIRLQDLSDYYSVLEVAEKSGMIFSGHWELAENPKTGKEIRMLDREKCAIPFLEETIKRFPKLRIIVEHVSTKEMAQLIKSAPANVAGTLTAHHALITYNDVFDCKGAVTNPDWFCKPCAKTDSDRDAILEAMVSGNPKFFFGSDSAPHPRLNKRGKNPAAGIFTPGIISLPLLCQIFNDCKVLSRLDNFVSNFGRTYYGLPQTEETITLEKKEWIVPAEICGIVPFMAGRKLDYMIAR
ncbi:MAG: hypothetical protein AAB906_03235 [Patescibacteria group bacterium]